ncbi:hypothetical protein V6N13_148433 [Hibiscus sabdariffa]|uniref:Uncharacterized protein n=1 Tax=Hibiscus sabdariffa TaxID=183260 RepID=A0ABR2TYJ3_9ROSI
MWDEGSCFALVSFAWELSRKKKAKYGFFFGFSQVGASNGTTQSFGGRSPLSHSPSLFLSLSNPCFEVVDNPMGFLLCVEVDDVFILGILAVKVSGEAVNLTVVVICVFIASPPVDITSAGAMVSTTSHELTRVWSWLSYKGFVDYNPFVLFLFEWYANNAFEMLGSTLLYESLRVQVESIEMAGVRWIMDSWDRDARLWAKSGMGSTNWAQPKLTGSGQMAWFLGQAYVSGLELLGLGSALWAWGFLGSTYWIGFGLADLFRTRPKPRPIRPVRGWLTSLPPNAVRDRI